MQKPRRGLCSSWLASLDPMSGLLNSEEVFAAATFSLLYIVTGLQGGLFSRLCHRHRFSLLWSGIRAINTILMVVTFASYHISGDVYVPLWVKKGSLKFPKDPACPVIMVGPGTGVAPFRSAVQERAVQCRTGERTSSHPTPLFNFPWWKWRLKVIHRWDKCTRLVFE